MTVPVRGASPLVTFLVRTVVVAVAVWVATLFVPGIAVAGATTASRVGTLLVVAVIFGLINATLKPLIKIVGCPLYVLTLGLIGLVVNALLFWLTGTLSSSLGLRFVVEGFWAGFWGAIVVSVVSFVLFMVIPDRYDAR